MFKIQTAYATAVELAWKDILFMVLISTSWSWVPIFDFEFCTLVYPLIAVVTSTQFFILCELTFVIWWLKIFLFWIIQKHLECRLLSYPNAFWVRVPTSLEGPSCLWLMGTGELFSPLRNYLGILDTFKLLISWCSHAVKAVAENGHFTLGTRIWHWSFKLWTNVKDDVFQNLQICDGCLFEATSHFKKFLRHQQKFISKKGETI